MTKIAPSAKPGEKALSTKWFTKFLFYTITVFFLITTIIVALPAYADTLNQSERHQVLSQPSQFGLDYSNVSFKSKDGLRLQGWWLGASDGAPVIIMLHGFGANRAEPASRVFGIAGKLVTHGYNVLLFDLRAHGQSEGTRTSAGYYEKNDLLGAIDYIKERSPTSKIGVLGFSMGAATALLTAPESKSISAVVADSSYSDVLGVLESQFSKRRLPTAVIPLLEFGSKIAYGVDVVSVRPVDAVPKITAPVFIIHGGKDSTVPVEQAFKLSDACTSPDKRFWVVPEASHTEAYSARPKEYISAVLSFFDGALG